MRRSTLYLAMALLVLGLTDAGYTVVSERQHKVEEIQGEADALATELSEERIARLEDQNKYRDQLLEIVTAVYNQELRLGGYETAAGTEVSEIYEAIINDVRDFEGMLENTDNYMNARVNYVEGIPSIWPLKYSTAIYVTSGFGTRYDPITGRFSFHPAMDIAGPRGTVILATADGVVGTHYPPPDKYYKGEDNFGGYVELIHAEGYETRYAHMSKTFVHEGEFVERGQPIGIMGSTGTSTGLHIHYEVLLNGEYKDPSDLLKL